MTTNPGLSFLPDSLGRYRNSAKHADFKSRIDLLAAARSVTVVEINDPTATGESLQFLEQDVVQLQSRPFRAQRVIVRLGDSAVLFHSTSVPVRARTRLLEGLTAFVVFGPHSVGTVNGLQLGPDRLLASSPGVELQLVVSAGYESITFLVPPEKLQWHMHGRCEHDHLPEGVELLTPSPSATRELFCWGRRLIDLAMRQPEWFDLRPTQTAAQAELLETLLATLHSSTPGQSTSGALTRINYSEIVQMAEDYVLAHAEERFHLTDLCRATGVSERTLQYAFKEVMSMTPVAYLTQLRLHRARQSLRSASHGTTTVSAEALRYGFWHFGDFTRAYKKCFGELPSETLRWKQ